MLTTWSLAAERYTMNSKKTLNFDIKMTFFSELRFQRTGEPYSYALPRLRPIISLFHRFWIRDLPTAIKNLLLGLILETDIVPTFGDWNAVLMTILAATKINSGSAIFILSLSQCLTSENLSKKQEIRRVF